MFRRPRRRRSNAMVVMVNRDAPLGDLLYEATRAPVVGLAVAGAVVGGALWGWKGAAVAGVGGGLVGAMFRSEEPAMGALGAPDAPPPPTEPLFPTAADTEAYLVWLKARVSDLDTAIQQDIPTWPEKVANGTLAPDQATQLPALVIDWNAWVLAWNKYAQSLSEQTWAGMVKRHAELEEKRSKWKAAGATVPEATKLPQGGINTPGGGLNEAASKVTTGLVIAGVVVAAVVAWKVLS